LPSSCSSPTLRLRSLEPLNPLLDIVEVERLAEALHEFGEFARFERRNRATRNALNECGGRLYQVSRGSSSGGNSKDTGTSLRGGISRSRHRFSHAAS
jgi:hypothetical protein